MTTRQEIEKALTGCRDPELGIDIVNLGLIYDVVIAPASVTIHMTLTTPGCPLVPYFHEEIVRAVQSVAGKIPVEIKVTFDPPWNPSRMTEQGRQQLQMLR